MTNSKENKEEVRADSEILETNVQMADKSSMLKVSQQGEDIENAPEDEILEDLENSSDTSSISDKSLTENELQILRSKEVIADKRIDQPINKTDEVFPQRGSNIELNQPFYTSDMERKGIKSRRKKNRRPKRKVGLKDTLKYQAPKIIKDDKAQEISKSRVTASKATMEEYPGELNDLKYWLHCKDVLGLTYEKEYAEIQTRIQVLEEAKYKEKENSTSERKKCKDIGK